MNKEGKPEWLAFLVQCVLRGRLFGVAVTTTAAATPTTAAALRVVVPAGFRTA